MKLIEGNKSNYIETGFFCKMSQKINEGYKRKLEWLESRFDEGLKIKMLDIKLGQRGFIEYIPGKYSRSVKHAANNRTFDSGYLPALYPPFENWRTEYLFRFPDICMYLRLATDNSQHTTFLLTIPPLFPQTSGSLMNRLHSPIIF